MCLLEKIEKLLDLELLDFVSLDVKAPFEKYRKVTGANVGSQVKKSMKLLNSDDNVHLEIRTTYVPTLHTKKDIQNLVNDVEGDIYTIQQFRNKNVLDPALEEVEEEEYKVLRTKAIPVKPITVDEAILQMNLIGHTFFVFNDAATGKTCVVYTRKDGNYGLIEPEI